MNNAPSAVRDQGNFIAPRPQWLALEQEPVLEPELRIVDPHHHLWDRPGDRYLLDEFLADCGSGHRIEATVFVECRAMYRRDGDELFRSLGETEFVNGIAAMSASGGYGLTRVADAIVGRVDLRFGDEVERALDAHLAVAGGRLRGIRNGSAWDAGGVRTMQVSPPPGLLADASFRRGFACLARAGLCFDAWLLHPQIGELDDLARRFADTTIILDHVGGPLGVGRFAGRRSEVFTEWRASIRRLAACENVHVKLGGLGMHTAGFDFHLQARPPSSEALARAWKPYVETCIEAFGVGRCMFESNFPVDKGSCSYRHLWNAFKRICADASLDQKRALFAETAAKVYRLQGATTSPQARIDRASSGRPTDHPD
ncbi:MAG: amidohydrolase [Lautropia sp.]